MSVDNPTQVRVDVEKQVHHIVAFVEPHTAPDPQAQATPEVPRALVLVQGTFDPARIESFIRRYFRQEAAFLELTPTRATASVSSVMPRAARCRVPNSLESSGLGVSGRKQAAAAMRSSWTITAPSWILGSMRS